MIGLIGLIGLFWLSGLIGLIWLSGLIGHPANQVSWKGEWVLAARAAAHGSRAPR